MKLLKGATASHVPPPPKYSPVVTLLTCNVCTVSHTHATVSVALGHSDDTSTLSAMRVRVLTIVIAGGGVSIKLDVVIARK